MPYGKTMTEAEYASEIIFIKDIPYLTLMGQLWWFYDDLGKNWPCYNGTAL